MPDPAPSSPAHSSRHGAPEHACPLTSTTGSMLRLAVSVFVNAVLRRVVERLEMRLRKPMGRRDGRRSGLVRRGEHLYCTASERTWQARRFDLRTADRSERSRSVGGSYRATAPSSPGAPDELEAESQRGVNGARRDWPRGRDPCSAAPPRPDPDPRYRDEHQARPACARWHRVPRLPVMPDADASP